MILGAVDYKISVNDVDIETAKFYSKKKSVFGCDENFESLALHFIADHDILFPTSCHDARELYRRMLTFVVNIEESFSWNIWLVMTSVCGYHHNSMETGIILFNFPWWYTLMY